MAQRKRRTLVAPEMNLSLDQSEGSVLSDDFLETPDDLDINVDDIETPDETDSLEFITSGNELEWEGQSEPVRCSGSGRHWIFQVYEQDLKHFGGSAAVLLLSSAPDLCHMSSSFCLPVIHCCQLSNKSKNL